MARLFFVQTVYVLFELKKLRSKQDATVHLLSLLEILPFGNIVRESRRLQAKDLRLALKISIFTNDKTAAYLNQIIFE